MGAWGKRWSADELDQAMKRVKASTTNSGMVLAGSSDKQEVCQSEGDVLRQSVKEGLPVLVGMCRACGLLVPEVEYRFHPTRQWRFDYAWPGMKVALEVEGGMWVEGRHNRGSGQVKDLEKYSEAAILGWRILYCQPSELPSVGMERIERALKGKRDGEAEAG